MWRSVVLDEYTTSTVVSTNTFSNVGTAVFVDDDSTDNSIAHNTITEAEYGVYVDDSSHGCYIGYNDISDTTYGFFIDQTDNCVVEYNTITLSRYNFGEGSSSPLVYTWNGEEYQYVADVGNPLFRFLHGVDNVSLPEGAIVPQDDIYSVKISQEYNEIVYYDELALTTIDHAVGYDAVIPLRRGQEDDYTTISDTPSHSLVSCVDMYGNDCVDELQASDDRWSYKDDTNYNSWVMNFGDLSGEERIILVLEGTRDYSLTAPGGSVRTLQVKDENGNWVDVFAPATIAGFRGAPRKQVIDLTGKFQSDDYSIKFGFDRTSLNYAAIDTSVEQSISINTVHPTTVDLQFRGYTAIDKTNFWNHDYETVFETPEERFAPQVGMFTKYGEVSPLLEETDDQFVIMHHGDHMSVEFPYTAPVDGLERTVIINNTALFKHADMSGGVGLTVEPLPFSGMTAYPPVAPQTYPMTDENELYRKTWNTREVKSGAATAFPNSENTTVRYNTINSLIEGEDPYAGDYGLHMFYEASSTVHNNTISGFDYGIYIENSDEITVHHNTLSDINQDGIYVYNTDDLIITYNTITDTYDDDGVDIQDSNNVTITTNTISNTSDSGMEIDDGEGYVIRGNTVSDIGDDGMDLENISGIVIDSNTITNPSNEGVYLGNSEEYTIVSNTVSSTYSSLVINGEYSGAADQPDSAYSGSYAWFSNYQDNQSTSLQRTLDLTGAETSAIFEYQMWYGTEACCDYIYTEVSTDNGVGWTQVGSSYSGSNTSWNTYEYDLSGYIGQEILVRVKFNTDGSVLGAGVYIDDASLTVDGDEVFTDTFELGVGSWVVSTESGPDWELVDIGVSGGEEVNVTKDVFDNVFTAVGLESSAVVFENVDNIAFAGNTIRGTRWIYNDGDNDFNDEDSGNTYLFADGSGAWTVYDITDSNGDGWADGGTDRPFSSSTLTTALWDGIGQDEYPATENEQVIIVPSSGGGGGNISSIPKPKILKEVISVNGALQINNGAATTDKTAVTLTINAQEAKEMAISNSTDFSQTTYVPFKSSVAHTLTLGNGSKTVYVKLRSAQGGVITISDSIVLVGQREEQVETNTTTLAEKPVVSQPDIAIPQNGLQCTTNLVLTTPVKLGVPNNPDDVKLLEQFLNTYEGTNLPVNGIYETADFNAVVKWQEKYASDILAPWGMTKGSGYVYTTSLKKIKEIHEKNCATAGTTPVQPATPVSASCLNTETTLTSGMTGALVTTAQTLLQKLNYFSITPTGFFGPVTTASVKAFQSANGIDSVGYIGPATRAKLNELGCW